MAVRRSLALIGLIFGLASCVSAPAAELSVERSTPAVQLQVTSSATAEPVQLGPTASPAPTRPVMTAETPTFLPTVTAAATAAPAVVSTATMPTPGPTATFDSLRRTPPTLMLHRSNPDFDAVAFLKDFVQILQRQHMRVVTYQNLTRLPDLTALEPGRLVIISIDDVSLQAPIDPTIQQMIAILREAKYPAVLGIVTEGKLPDQETARQLKALAGEGWELAMHTENHVDLHVLEQTNAYGARLEIRTCAQKINQATGVQPSTLVLPYGSMVENFKILYRENVHWVVGITGGEVYRTTNQVYYVGRDGPSGDAANTFKVMMGRFNRP